MEYMEGLLEGFVEKKCPLWSNSVLPMRNSFLEKGFNTYRFYGFLYIFFYFPVQIQGLFLSNPSSSRTLCFPILPKDEKEEA